jgi:hypothetical protein
MDERGIESDKARFFLAFFACTTSYILPTVTKRRLLWWRKLRWLMSSVTCFFTLYSKCRSCSK